MENNQINYSLPVYIYGELQPYSDTISKARCRVFYKYGNRNSSYITDEFAEKLLSTIPYTPVKGIYEKENEDFTDHGEKRDEGRIYGIVPEQTNFAWEKHLDEDGVEREYACVDIFVFTALYEEAKQIIGKALSMEIYDKTAKGDWIYFEGKKYFAFTEGSFLGLQILGETVEPCFEGAGFFTLYNYVKDIFKELEKRDILEKKEEKKPMDFKLFDNEKFNLLWKSVNGNFTEEKSWMIDYELNEINDEYILAYNVINNEYVKIPYSIDEENNLTMGEITKTFMLNVDSEEELNALKALYSANENTYVGLDNILTENAQLKEENSNFVSKLEELEAEKNTLTTEKDGVIIQLNEATITINSLTEEVETLNSFKQNVEKIEKESIISTYENLLNADIIERYTNEMDNFSARDLDKELAYELKNATPDLFTKIETPIVHKDKPMSELEAVLSRAKNR